MHLYILSSPLLTQTGQIYYRELHIYTARNPSSAEAREAEKKMKPVDEKKKMKPVDEKKETLTFRAVSRDEEGRKPVEKAKVSKQNIDKLKYTEKKLVDKGVHRMERHPADGLPLAHGPPKFGHGGKYTWEGPAENEMEAVPAAVDEKDPNYVEEEERLDGEVTELVVGEVEVPKAAEVKEGVARIEVHPHLIEG
ncbi:uncharacterized protein LOC132285170 [Cornus florida]|uniref:uncharacterized protein LOC132285170 n=1 Tax=Cornus florida TaxID=4283 RepID=UPI002896CBD9|nr:uncharacterized protein LOC132285170 [Cornus florida]